MSFYHLNNLYVFNMYKFVINQKFMLVFSEMVFIARLGD